MNPIIIQQKAIMHFDCLPANTTNETTFTLTVGELVEFVAKIDGARKTQRFLQVKSNKR